MNEKTFIQDNEHEFNKIAAKILIWTAVVVFPALFVLNYFKIFSIYWPSLIILSITGTILAFVPIILLKLGAASS